MFRVAGTVLPRAHAAHGDGIDVFEMTGVEAECKMNLVTARRLPIVVKPLVIFYVTASAEGLGVFIFVFAENLSGIFAHDICEHVKAAAVCHPNDDFVDALFTGFIDSLIEKRNQAFRPFERKAFCTLVFLLDEFFETDRVSEAGENTYLFLAGERKTILGALDAIL